MLRVLMIALASAGTPALAEIVTARPLAELDWRSSPGDEVKIAAEISLLYQTLYNTGNLATREVPNPEGLFLERLMRQEGVFFGAYFPQNLDNVLCDLNTHICSRERYPVSEKQLLDLSAHVGGLESSPSRWRFRGHPDLKVRIPDYDFSSYTLLTKTQVPSDWVPKQYTPSHMVDCSAWETDCQSLVERLNPQLYGKKTRSTSQTVVLPVAGLSVQVPLRPEEQSQYYDLLSKMGDEQPKNETEFAGPSAKQSGLTLESHAPDISRTDLAIQSLERNIVSIGGSSDFGVRDEPLFDQQVELFRLIQHPFAEQEELPEEYRGNVGILVLDADGAGTHCDLTLDALPEGANTCGEIEAAPHPIRDHSLHVVGLISAPMNQRGIVGLNPEANVIFGSINREFTSPADILNVIQQLQSNAFQGVRIANMSWGFDREVGSSDFLRDQIATLDSTMLVVAAAGNENKDVSEDCRIFPACMHQLDNVLTVVGLDRDPSNPSLWQRDQTKGSNYNSEFHIGAIADNVLSTIPGDRLGRMSGTSQAAPQVTAAASLIFSAAEFLYPDLIEQKLAPKIVKDRLIYTADHFLGLQSKLKSGRLNVSRAINVVDTQIVVEQENGPVSYKGSLKAIPVDHIQCLQAGGDVTKYAWGSIRRMIYVPNRDRYILYVNDNYVGDTLDNRYQPLRRVDGCNLNTLSHQGKIKPRGGDEIDFRLGDVVDYTSALLE